MHSYFLKVNMEDDTPRKQMHYFGTAINKKITNNYSQSNNNSQNNISLLFFKIMFLTFGDCVQLFVLSTAWTV